MPFARRFHPGKIGLFALLSATDLLLTWLLIRHGDGFVYESNPMASWWLEKSGWLGLAFFKLVQVVAVVTLSIVISRRRPRLGGFVLSVGCVVLTGVVAYSLSLGGNLERTAEGEPTTEDLTIIAEREGRLTAQLDLANEYREVLDRLCGELAEGRVSLADATVELARTERVRSQDWMRHLHHSYPGRPDDQCLAANLVTHTLANLSEEPHAAETALDRLAVEFHAAFGDDLPENPQSPLRRWMPVEGIDDDKSAD